MRYQKIHSQIWHDEKFPGLSDGGKLLFIYILSSPHSNSIGLYVIPKPYIMADLNWTSQQLSKPFAELLSKGLIRYDEDIKLLLIPNHLKHNPIENQNQTKAAIKIVASLPKTSIISDIFELLSKPFHKPLLEALLELYSEPEEETEEKEKEKTEEKKASSSTVLSVQDLVDGWNNIVATEDGFKQVAKLTGDRKKRIKLRLKAHPDPEFWNKVLNKIPCVPFLCGKNDRHWRADFDFLIKNDENALKIFEGKYDAEKR